MCFVKTAIDVALIMFKILPEYVNNTIKMTFLAPSELGAVEMLGVEAVKDYNSPPVEAVVRFGYSVNIKTGLTSI